MNLRRLHFETLMAKAYAVTNLLIYHLIEGNYLFLKKKYSNIDLYE